MALFFESADLDLGVDQLLDRAVSQVTGQEAGPPAITATEYISWVKRSLNRQYSTRLKANGKKTSGYRDTVRRFQRDFGLSQTGEVNSPTQNKLITNNETQRAYMVWVHEALGRVSIPADPPRKTPDSRGRYKSTGVRQGIRTFQQREKLTVDAFVGAKTEALLIRRCKCTPPGHIKPGSKGKPRPPVRPARIETREFSIVAKSFIARIGSRAGAGEIIRGKVFCPGTFGPLGAAAELKALAKVTDWAYSENPRDDDKDDGYRLYSRFSFWVRCRDGKIDSVVSRSIQTDVGLECVPSTGVCLRPPDIKLSRVTARKTGQSTFEFTWMARGRPHNLAEPALQLVCPRTSKYIWHRVTGRFDCRKPDKLDVSIRGSRFPSHRLFVNNVVTQSIRQGPLIRLWMPMSGNPSLVR